MDPRLIYLLVFISLFLFAFYLQKKHCFICDATDTVNPKPYSYSRLQLAWWTFIVLSAFISIALASGEIPSLDYSTLKLLGIGILTSASARIIDISDTNAAATAAAAATATAATTTAITTTATATTPATTTTPTTPLSKDMPSQGFWLDVLSDKTGVSIHRLQALVFNLVFGVWFIYRCVINIKPISTQSVPGAINGVMPVISDPNLILLGLSAGAYAALKSAENK